MSVNVVIDVKDKEKTLSPAMWETDIVVRPWRFACKQSYQNDRHKW